jgi:hypothetical protein
MLLLLLPSSVKVNERDVIEKSFINIYWSHLLPLPWHSPTKHRFSVVCNSRLPVSAPACVCVNQYAEWNLLQMEFIIFNFHTRMTRSQPGESWKLLLLFFAFFSRKMIVLCAWFSLWFLIQFSMNTKYSPWLILTRYGRILQLRG